MIKVNSINLFNEKDDNNAWYIADYIVKNYAEFIENLDSNTEPMVIEIPCAGIGKLMQGFKATYVVAEKQACLYSWTASKSYDTFINIYQYDIDNGTVGDRLFKMEIKYDETGSKTNQYVMDCYKLLKSHIMTKHKEFIKQCIDLYNSSNSLVKSYNRSLFVPVLDPQNIANGSTKYKTTTHTKLTVIVNNQFFSRWPSVLALVDGKIILYRYVTSWKRRG